MNAHWRCSFHAPAPQARLEMSHIATYAWEFYPTDEPSNDDSAAVDPQETPACSTDRTRSSSGGWSYFRNTRSG